MPQPNLPLAGQVAVVTGASRGAGRGVAIELGAAGATIYVTGRSTRDRPAGGYEQVLALSKLSTLPGSVDATAEEVAALFERVQREQGRLDLLVNNEADPAVIARTGQVLRVADLAAAYGFTDVDGRWVPAFEMEHAQG